MPSQRREAIQWAHHRTNGVCGHLCIERGGVELGMPEQDLNETNVSVLLQQVGAKLCRNVCGVTRFLISAIWAAA
jgi:hypothetical protein